MKRGTILWINLEPFRPPEFGKTRPGIIVSNTEQNIRLSTVVILPLSSQAPEIWPLRIGMKMPDGRASYVVVPGIRQVDKQRLLETITLAPTPILEKIDEALAVYLRD